VDLRLIGSLRIAQASNLVTGSEPTLLSDGPVSSAST
jgi:hypothetical protein